MTNYYCYMIVNDKNHTYIGITNNINKRLDQHNGKIANGAKHTKKSNNWVYYYILGGDNLTKSLISSFEWYWKHRKSKITDKWYIVTTLKNRKIRLIELLKKDEWKNIKILKVEKFKI